MKRFAWLALTGLAVFSGLAGLPAAAYETDQYNQRLMPLVDSTAILDREVNRVLTDICSTWDGPRDEKRFVRKVFNRIGGRHWVDRLERWAMTAPEVDRLDIPRRDSIYTGHPLRAARVAKVFGIGSTIRVNDSLIGSDKLGHFLSQGKKYWFRWQRSGSEEQAAKQSAFTERAIFGQPFTGSYSNADLVANFEGYRFYRSLFEDQINGEKPAIVLWKTEGCEIQRQFTWMDHVNDYWDEAAHPNHFDRLLKPHMIQRLKTFCPDYHRWPERWELRNEEDYAERYSHLELRDTTDLRLESLCNEEQQP